MAQYELIDSYLGTFRNQLRRHRDADELIAEVEDHLVSAVEHTSTPDLVAAQRLALERFGDPQVLAEAFASTTTGGIAVPTRFTKLAGTAGIIAAVAWPLAIVLGFLMENNLGLIPWLVAIGATAVFAGGVYSRHGGALGVIGRVGMIIFYVGVAIAGPLFWAIPVYMALMGAGLLLVGATAYRAGVLPQLPNLLYASAFAVGGIVFAVGRTLEIGDPDRWGDYIGVNQVAVVVGFGLFAIAAAWLGRWLAAEEPADITPTGAVTA